VADNTVCDPIWHVSSRSSVATLQIAVHLLLNLFAAFSALTLLVGWQEGHAAYKKLSGGCWRGYLSRARCRLEYGPSDADWFTFLVLAYLDSPIKRAINRVYACMLLLTPPCLLTFFR